MSVQVKWRGGSAADIAGTVVEDPPGSGVFVSTSGAKEIWVNTDTWTIHVQDGSTPGGHPLTKAPRSNRGAGPFVLTDNHTSACVFADTSAGPVSVTLPPGPDDGITVFVKDIGNSAAAHNATIAGGTIDGAASLVIATDRGAARLIASGGVWIVL